MSINLVLGLLSLAVGTATLVVTLVLPPPPRSVADPYAGIARRSWFLPLVLGLVPLAAGLAFVGAWWQETPVASASYLDVERPAP